MVELNLLWNYEQFSIYKIKYTKHKLNDDIDAHKKNFFSFASNAIFI